MLFLEAPDRVLRHPTLIHDFPEPFGRITESRHAIQSRGRASSPHVLHLWPRSHGRRSSGRPLRDSGQVLLANLNDNDYHLKLMNSDNESMGYSIEARLDEGGPRVSIFDEKTGVRVVEWQYRESADFKGLFQKLMLISCLDSAHGSTGDESVGISACDPSEKMARVPEFHFSHGNIHSCISGLNRDRGDSPAASLHPQQCAYGSVVDT